MTANTLPAPLLPPGVVATVPRGRARTYLSVRVRFAFALIVALVAGVTGSAAGFMQGAAASVAIVLGSSTAFAKSRR